MVKNHVRREREEHEKKMTRGSKNTENFPEKMENDYKLNGIEKKKKNHLFMMMMDQLWKKSRYRKKYCTSIYKKCNKGVPGYPISGRILKLSGRVSGFFFKIVNNTSNKN